MKIVSVIPVRGGSKGIHKKNIIDVNGKPLVYYIIKASLNSIVDETWVSSDDDEILKIAKGCGAKTIKRPSEFATDKSQSEETLLHFAENVDFDMLVFLQATSPLTTSQDINDAIGMMDCNDSVVGMTECSSMIWIDNKPNYDPNNRKMRQDSNKTLIETGALYITKKEGLLKSKCRFTGKVGQYIFPKIRGFDINDYEDLDIIRIILEYRKTLKVKETPCWTLCRMS